MNRSQERFFVLKAITLLLKVDMCSLHCTAQPLKDDGAIASSRIEVEDGVWCQAQCWRNSKKRKNLELFGLKALKDPNNQWNFTAEDLFQASWLVYKEFHYSLPTSGPSVNDLSHADTPKTRSGTVLPVCFSDMKPGDFHDKDQSELLACSCGDRLGNETTQFFADIHMDEWVGYDGGTGVAEACQTSFDADQSDSVTVFLTFCQMDQHFPYEADKHHAFLPSADYSCDAFKQKLEALDEKKSYSTLEVNCHMCKTSKIGRNIMEHQAEFYRHS